MNIAVSWIVLVRMNFSGGACISGVKLCVRLGLSLCILSKFLMELGKYLPNKRMTIVFVEHDRLINVVAKSIP